MPNRIGLLTLIYFAATGALSAAEMPYRLTIREMQIVREGAYALFKNPDVVRRDGLVIFGAMSASTSTEYPESVMVCGFMKRGDFKWDLYAGTYAHAVRGLPARFALAGAGPFDSGGAREFCENHGILPPGP